MLLSVSVGFLEGVSVFLVLVHVPNNEEMSNVASFRILYNSDGFASVFNLDQNPSLAA